MKICLVSGSYPPVRCGVGDQVQVLAEQLSARGEEVSVLCSGPGSESMENGVRVLRSMPDWPAWRLPQLLKMLGRLQPEVVHLHYPSLGFRRSLAPNLLFAGLLGLQPRIKSLLTLHEYAALGRAGRLRLWPTLRFSHRLVCTNHLDWEELRQDYPGQAERSLVIPLGSNVGSAAEAQATALRPFSVPDKNRFWFLHFGTVMPNKGWEILIPALERLLRKGLAVGLLAIGELQPERYPYHRKIHELIASSAAAQAVHFTGYLDKSQIAAIFTALPIVVLPFAGGARLNRSSLVTALAYARAIVTTSPMRRLEQLDPVKHYWEVLPRDPRDLAAGMERLWQDKALVRKLQANARQAAEYFSWERIVRLYRGIYGQLRGA